MEYLIALVAVAVVMVQQVWIFEWSGTLCV